jgi:hypothetical protein
MSKLNLQHVLDEILILHASIATRLLNEYPDAYGVALTLSRERSYAMAKMDVPEGYADGYREPGLEKLATELLEEISPRMNELYDTLSPAVSKKENIYLSAYRNDEKKVRKKMGGIELSGSIVGAIGSQAIQRQIMFSKDRIMAFNATRFKLTGIIRDTDTASKIEAAAEKGIAAAWEAMHEEKVFLNSAFPKKLEIVRMRRWLEHFPNPAAKAKFQLKEQVCQITTISQDRMFLLAVKSDDPIADPAQIKSIEESGMEVFVFDPVTGFKHEEAPALKVR